MLAFAPQTFMQPEAATGLARTFESAQHLIAPLMTYAGKAIETSSYSPIIGIAAVGTVLLFSALIAAGFYVANQHDKHKNNLD